MTSFRTGAARGPRLACRRVLLGAALALAVAGAGGARADAPAAAAATPPAVAQPCLACHGAVPAVGAPVIAGQTSNFIQWQLVFFRGGRRQNPIMQGMAAKLSDDDIRALGGYFAALPVPKPAAIKDEQPDLSKAGAALGNQRHCTSCHGETYLGQAAAPRLAHQPEAYLAKSLTDYRSGARPSSGGAAMTEVAGGLAEDDIKALAHYLATLP